MAAIAGKSFDKEELAVLIVEKLKEKIQLWNTSSQTFWDDYFNFLFKRGIPTAFRDNNNQDFMGIIQGVSPIGKLQVLLEDDSVAEFEIKEVKMLY
jgi:BirA family biotin operon repressor/biotin-[acetyl-CoA-carboxylase] ligase